MSLGVSARRRWFFYFSKRVVFVLNGGVFVDDEGFGVSSEVFRC